MRIDCEDSVIIAGNTSITDFIIELNFFSFYAERSVIVDGNNFTLKADLIKNFIQIFGRGNKVIKFSIKKDFTYDQQHKSLLNGSYDKLCTYSQGKELMLSLDRIKKNKI